MTPQLYLEYDTDLQKAKAEEWFGREYARDISMPYPVPPDTPNPPPEAFTWFYTRAIPKAGSGGGASVGGVHVLDDEMVRFATQTQELSDGEDFFIDLESEAKTFEQLSEAGQAVIPQPPPDI